LAREELERRPVEGEAVVLAGDGERIAELARTGAERALRLDAAPGAHRFESVRRLERPDECRLRTALDVADDVQAPVDPVAAVDIGGPGRAEHRARPRRRPAVA